MSKNRIILAAVGGVIAVAAAAAAAFAYFAFAAKVAAVEGDDEAEGLESVVAKVQKLSRAPVYPCARSVKELDENSEKVAEWLKSVRSCASAGDRVYEKTTPAAFKTFLVRDAKRLVSQPGEASGAIAKPDFAFGPFRNYITGGDMPSEAQLSVLQRRWDDVATVTEALVACGVGEIVDMQFKAEEKKPEEEAAEKKPKRNARKQNKGKAAAKPQAEPAGLSSAYTYVFTFTARQPALVKVVNAFATSERFVTVDDISFRRSKDAIAEALPVEEAKPQDAAASGGRRRRRGGAAAVLAEEKKDAAASGIVTDPLADSPFTVTMTVTVHDFRSLEEADAGKEKAEEGKK